MKKKYLYCFISSFLLLFAPPAFAQEGQATNSIGEIGFVEKKPPEKPPEFRETQSQVILGNRSLPKVGEKIFDPLGFEGLVAIGTVALIRKRLTNKKDKENFHEKNGN